MKTFWAYFERRFPLGVSASPPRAQEFFLMTIFTSVLLGFGAFYLVNPSSFLVGLSIAAAATSFGLLTAFSLRKLKRRRSLEVGDFFKAHLGALERTLSASELRLKNSRLDPDSKEAQFLREARALYSKAILAAMMLHRELSGFNKYYYVHFEAISWSLAPRWDRPDYITCSKIPELLLDETARLFDALDPLQASLSAWNQSLDLILGADSSVDDLEKFHIGSQAFQAKFEVALERAEYDQQARLEIDEFVKSKELSTFAEPLPELKKTETSTSREVLSSLRGS